MPLKDEKIQDNRIRPTPEIGCPGHVACAACLHAGQAHAVVPMQRPDRGMVALPSLLRRGSSEGAEHIRLLNTRG